MTFIQDQNATDTAITYIKRAQSFLIPALAQQRHRSDELFAMKSKEGDANPSYGFDDASNQILFDTLTERSFDCHIFSEEEHSWKTVGVDPKYYVICDPFCNSFLASRTFRDAAVAICISDLNGQFAACAIGDLQINKIYYANKSGAYVLEDYDKGKGSTTPIRVSTINTVDQAFIVTPLLKSSRRTQIDSFQFFHRAKIIHGVDGAIMIARLAGGYIDAYLDPLKGQPLYEVPCCELIIKAGGIVTDETGRPFQLSEIISQLSNHGSARYKIVAASNKELHKALIDEISLNRKNE